MAKTAANDLPEPNVAMAEAPRLRRLTDNRTHTLSAVTLVGRNEECDVVIDDEQGVSRKHARFTVDGQQVQMLDLGSLNGTLINGKEADGQHTLTNGDILVFDEQEYELLIPGAEAEEYDSDITVIANRADIGRRGRMVSEVSVVDDAFLRRVRQANPPARDNETPAVKHIAPLVDLSADSPEGEALESISSSAADVANLTQPTLIVRGGDSMRIRLALDNTRNSWTIGSAVDRDLSIEHDGVAANHAILLREGSVWTLCDRQSGSGSYVNGKRIDSADIVSGDVLRLGNVDCLFVCPTDDKLHNTQPPAIKRSKPISIDADYDQQSTDFYMAIDDYDAPPFKPQHADDHGHRGGKISPRKKRHGGFLQRLGLDPRILLTLCIATTLVLTLFALVLLM
ncbi:MAG: FHA domain-containing protein [Granulosicoccus sp.]